MPPRKKTEATEPEVAETTAPEATEPEAAPEVEAPAPGEAEVGVPVDLDPDKVTPVAPAEPVPAPQFLGSTFAERRAAREAAEGKQVTGGDAENKAIQK